MAGRIGIALALTWLCAFTLAGTAALARPGFYIGVGAAQQTAEGDLDGTHVYRNSSDTVRLTDGKLDGGSIGLAAQIGYGINNFLALEYLYADTKHKAESDAVSGKKDAELQTQMAGVRLTVPLGQRVEAFLRAGVGRYDVTYDEFSVTGPALSKSGKVTFRGDGTAWGAGLEFFFNELGIGLGYTQHNYAIDRAKPESSSEQGLKSELTGAATTTDVMFTFHF